MIIKKATFGAGCFWCVEAVFQKIHGVTSVVSGYMGGHVKNPSYKEVCNGDTGHAEVCELSFNPEVVSYLELLKVFWYSHDPTTLNRQGNDVGSQYRSGIYYHSDSQREEAELLKKKLNEEVVFGGSVVTEILPASIFYPAENYHQNYFNLNKDQPYCQMVIRPKLEKLEKLLK